MTTALQGRVFGGYQLAEQLPGGGIAEVYRARPTMSGGRDVVVKVIHPEFAHQPGFLPHFRHIVQLSGRLATHPHILPLVANGEENGYLYLVTPYVAAGTLKDWLAGGGRLSAADVAPFFRQLCDALGHAHSLGIIHGNLKPSNVFLFEGKHVLLGDFGMLWDVAHMDMSHAGPEIEAVAYLAPEVASAPVTQLSDVYSAGALLFTTITGRPPYTGATLAEVFAAHAHQPIPRLTPGSGALPPPAMRALDAVVQRALAKRPEDRFPSAAAMAQAIEVAVRQASTALPPQAGPGMMMGWPPHPGNPGNPGNSGVPQSGPVFPFPGASAPMPQSSAPLGRMPGLPGFGGGMPVFGPAAAGMGMGAALENVSATLQPLDPPFPRLHTGELIEGQMEQGRAGTAPFSSGDLAGMPTSAQPARTDAWNGALAALESENTLRVPAPPLSGQTPGDAGRGGGIGGAPDGEGGFGEDALGVARGVRGLAPSRGGLGQRLGTLKEGNDDEDAEPGPRSMPAIRLDAAQPQGFTVAGGSGQPGAPGAVGPQSPAAGGEGEEEDSAFGGPRGFMSGGPAGEHAGELALPAFPAFGQSALGLDSAGGNGNGHSPLSDMGAMRPPEPWPSRGLGLSDGTETGQRPFSATALELPRLTGHDLSGIPSNWQEFVGNGSGGPANGRHGNPASSFAPADSGAGWSAAAAPWRSSPGATDGHDWGGAAEPGWEGQRGSGNDTWAASAQLSASLPALSGPLAEAGASASAVAVAPARGRRWLGRGQRAEPADLANEGFFDTGYDDASGWSRGLSRLRGGRYRTLRKTALFATLILLFDLCVLVLARPELCPTKGCLLIDQRVHALAPTLYNNPALFPLSARPATVTIAVTAGSSATGKVSLTNTSDAPVTWQATSGLPWVTLGPATGTLKAGASASLTLTARPNGIKPGLYSTEVTVTVGSDTVPIPVQVTVETSGQHSNVSPPLVLIQAGDAPPAFTIVTAWHGA